MNCTCTNRIMHGCTDDTWLEGSGSSHKYSGNLQFRKGVKLMMRGVKYGPFCKTSPRGRLVKTFSRARARRPLTAVTAQLCMHLSPDHPKFTIPCNLTNLPPVLPVLSRPVRVWTRIPAWRRTSRALQRLKPHPTTFVCFSHHDSPPLSRFFFCGWSMIS
jgi:hypothetical protein